MRYLIYLGGILIILSLAAPSFAQTRLRLLLNYSSITRVSDHEWERFASLRQNGFEPFVAEDKQILGAAFYYVSPIKWGFGYRVVQVDYTIGARFTEDNTFSGMEVGDTYFTHDYSFNAEFFNITYTIGEENATWTVGSGFLVYARAENQFRYSDKVVEVLNFSQPEKDESTSSDGGTVALVIFGYDFGGIELLLGAHISIVAFKIKDTDSELDNTGRLGKRNYDDTYADFSLEAGLGWSF